MLTCLLGRLHTERVAERGPHDRYHFRDHPYIMAAKGLGGWVQKMAIFADVQYYIYADIVGGSEKVKKYADII